MAAIVGGQQPGRMSRLAALLAPLAATALLAATVPAAHAVLPEEITVKDGGSSDPSVDISKVTAEASWYWDSEQAVRVQVPGGLRTGQRLSIWFDVDGDAVSDGHYELRLGKVKNKKQKYLAVQQEFRRGGGWTHGGKVVRCTGSEDGQPLSSPVRRGEKGLGIYLDLWGCLDVPTPGELGSGAWRVAVAVARNGEVDMAPDHRTWSPYVAGWGPCDPSGGSCS